MNTQPEALRLADALDADATNSDMGRKPDSKCHKRQASTELRRLHEANAYFQAAYGQELKTSNELRRANHTLLEALKAILEDIDSDHGTGYEYAKARAAIAKGEKT